jgi:hypothetical protein
LQQFSIYVYFTKQWRVRSSKMYRRQGVFLLGEIRADLFHNHTHSFVPPQPPPPPSNAPDIIAWDSGSHVHCVYLWHELQWFSDIAMFWKAAESRSSWGQRVVHDMWFSIIATAEGRSHAHRDQPINSIYHSPFSMLINPACRFLFGSLPLLNKLNYFRTWIWIAQSIWRVTTCWKTGVRLPAAVRVYPDRFWDPHVLLYNRHWKNFTGVKAAGAWSWQLASVYCRG